MPGPLFNALPNLSLEDKSINMEEAVATHFALNNPYLHDRMKFALSKKFTDFVHTEENWDYLGDGVILGTLPYQSQCDKIIQYAAKQGKPLGLVISVVEYFELSGSVALDPIATPLHWSKKNINHYLLPMKDFTSIVSIAAIIPAIDVMRTCILNNQSVYIHCKAGVGRSCLFAAVYFSIYNLLCANLEGEPSLDKAMSIIKPKRNQVKLDASKRQKALDAVYVIKKILQSESVLSTDEKEVKQIDIFSTSPAGKDEIESIPSPDSSLAESKETESVSLSEDFIKVPVPFPLTTIAQLIELNAFLALTQTKLKIAQLVSFKQLGIYGASIIGFFNNRVSIIDKFFKEINNAKNAAWYLGYHEKLHPLLDANPKLSSKRPQQLFDLEEDVRTRKELYFNFYNEVTNFINNQLGFKLQVSCEEKEAPPPIPLIYSSFTDYASNLIKHGLYAGTAVINSAYTLCTTTVAEETMSSKLTSSS
jgi:protein-tyrosine phosphatase